jgi:hypothetical protein
VNVNDVNAAERDGTDGVRGADVKSPKSSSTGIVGGEYVPVFGFCLDSMSSSVSSRACRVMARSFHLRSHSFSSRDRPAVALDARAYAGMSGIGRWLRTSK